MEGMFNGASLFNQDISKRNVEKVSIPAFGNVWAGFRKNSALSDEHTPAKFK